MPIGNLTQEEKDFLLDLAKKSIHEKVNNNIVYLPDEKTVPEPLKEPGAAFVTIKKNGKLSGCIGVIIAQDRLYKSVRDMAISAATEDPRFFPLTKNDLDKINIEITVLGHLEEIKDHLDFELGKYGLYLKHGFKSGVLLPQVPLEFGWSKEEFLDHLCFKAGLSAGDWNSDDAIIYRFSGEIIKE